MNRIFIVGYMGVGKTTVGKKLAKALGLSFIDLDAHIQSTYRKTIAQLFNEKGETEFRKLERNALLELANFENVVVSTGGGAPCFFDNMDLMNKAGTTIYIQAEPDELASRLKASKTVRPLISDKSPDELLAFITQHLAQRECYYKKAQFVYHTNHLVTKKDVNLTVEGIQEMLKNGQNNV